MAFRGLIAPASLKPEIFLGVWSNMITFRGLIAPASLKRGWWSSWVMWCDVLPGPNRPGLIEAAAPEAQAHQAPFLPGPNRPGLIEANSVHGIAQGVHAFRGLIAPASLKPGPGMGRMDRRLGPFRGLIAPASLKQFRAW